MVTQYCEDPHGCYSPNYRATSHELLHNSRSTAAVMVSSLFRVPTVRGRPAFSSDEGLDASCHIKTLLQPSKHISDSMTSASVTYCVFPCVSTGLRVKSMSQYSSCVYGDRFIRTKPVVGPSANGAPYCRGSIAQKCAAAHLTQTCNLIKSQTVRRLIFFDLFC